jgi:hypothetical protein
MEWILKFSPTPWRVTVIQTMGTIFIERRKLKQQLVIINPRFDALSRNIFRSLGAKLQLNAIFTLTRY